jgi:hypothetical protein
MGSGLDALGYENVNGDGVAFHKMMKITMV